MYSKATAKASTPVSNHSRPRSQAQGFVRPPSPKIDNSLARRASGSPAPKVPLRANSRKSPSSFIDSHERSKSRLSCTEDELNDQHLLSLSQYEKYDSFKDEQQSIFERSVVADTVLHELLEKQRADNQLKHSAGKHSSPDLGAGSPTISAKEGGHGAGSGLAFFPLFERDVTESSALSALTEEPAAGEQSDEGTISEKTQHAAFHSSPLSLVGESDPADLVRSLTDEQLTKLLELMRLEQDARDRSKDSSKVYGFEVNVSLVETRRGLRRSRSGGSDAASAFYHGKKPSSSAAKNPSPLKQDALHCLSVDTEDAEVGDAFAPEMSRITPSLTPTPPAASGHVNANPRSASRNSGAHQSLEKIITSKHSSLPCVSPPSSVDHLPCTSSPLVSYYSSTNNTSSHSPLIDLASQSSSRPASRLNGMLHLHTLLPQEERERSAPTSPAIPHARRANKRTVSSAESTVEDMVGDMGLQEEDMWNNSAGGRRGGQMNSAPLAGNNTNNNSNGNSNNNNFNSVYAAVVDGAQQKQEQQQICSRGELVLSPFSAFDDISVGSQSISSSLSSKTKRIGMDATNSPPMVSGKHVDRVDRHRIISSHASSSALRGRASSSDGKKGNKK